MSKQPTSPIVPACTTSAHANETASVLALPSCEYRESGGAQCERERGHEGRHTFDDAIFIFLHWRWDLQGPICRCRRGPPEIIYDYEERPLCL